MGTCELKFVDAAGTELDDDELYVDSYGSVLRVCEDEDDDGDLVSFSYREPGITALVNGLPVARRGN